MMLPVLLFGLLMAAASGQRITTIQLDGVQYFISRMNPYSPELNYFLAYQYCRSLGLQLASFESQEKADSLMEYLRNAGYNKYDYWTSGNKLGTSDMLLWMSTGLPFNSTFNYMRKLDANELHQTSDVKEEEAAEGRGHRRRSRGEYINPNTGCVSLKAPDLQWETDNCNDVKDFICEQTRCYYYNYGSIPVSTSQGGNKFSSTLTPYTTTTTSTTEASTTTTTTSTTENPSTEAQQPTASGRASDVNRRAPNRPSADKPPVPSLSSIFSDLLPSSRSVSNKSLPSHHKESDSNVVYVTAVGVGSGQERQSGDLVESANTAVPTTVQEEPVGGTTVKVEGPKTFVRGKVVDPPIVE